MEVDYAFLASAAEVSNGKFHAVGGGFDTIWTKEVPVRYPALTFVLRIIFDAAEMDREHSLEIQVMDEDGKRLITVGGKVSVPNKSSTLPKGWKQGILTQINFNNLELPKFGDYSFNVVINNTSLKSVPLRVAQRLKIQSS